MELLSSYDVIVIGGGHAECAENECCFDKAVHSTLSRSIPHSHLFDDESIQYT